MLKLQYKVALQIFLVCMLVAIVGIVVHQKITTKASYQKALFDHQALSQELAISIDAILREKANKVKAFSSAPIIESLLQESNTSFSSLPVQVRKDQIAELNERWMQDDDLYSPFIQSYITNAGAEFLKKQLELNPGEYGEIFLTNRFGALVATTGKLTTLAHGHKYWWKNSYDDGRGKIFFDDRGFDSSVGGCVLGVVVPIKKDDQIIGILKSNVLIQRVLTKVVDTEQFPFLHETDAQDHSHVTRAIVRSGGKIVTQPGIEPLSQDIHSEIKPLLLTKDTAALLTDINGTQTFAAFSRIPVTRGNEHYGFGGSPKSIDHSGGNQNEDWSIVITQPVSMAMKIQNQSNRLLYAFAAILAFFMAIAALFIGRWITRPINALLTAIPKIERGDFSVAIDRAASRDELGRVVQSFNRMASGLAQTQESLLSEQKQRQAVEKELRQRHKMEAVGSLAGGIAHNFNNNLSIILGNLELASLKKDQPETLKPYLDSAMTATLRSRDLVRQIMIYSHHENHEQKNFSLAQTVRETLELLSSTIPSTVVIKSCIAVADNLSVCGDEILIQQSLINLCTNAVHAMKEKGDLNIRLDSFEIEDEGELSRYMAKPGTYLCLSVSDNGCGMDDFTIERAFDPFFTTKEVGQGTGMGLATVKGVVTQHQGFIDVESSPGEGTTISLFFPAQIYEKRFSESEEAGLKTGSGKILLVDDEVELLVVGKNILEEIGYQVETADSAELAIELFKKAPGFFDLVITDQIMPRMTGSELVCELKKMDKNIPVVLCTGYDTEISAGEFESLGISAFVLKPLKIDELGETVRSCLNHQSSSLP